MSLIKLFRKKCKYTLFTTPSHAQGLYLFSKFKQLYRHDISETDAYNPQKALLKAQSVASSIYKTKSTFFLTNGSSSGIIAAVLACVNANESVLIWDKAHPSHKNAVELAGASTVFYKTKKINDWDVFGQVETNELEEKFKNNKIKAVIVTSPTYEGLVSDIKEISVLCKKYEAYLIVDEAHGALYPFCDKLPQSAIYQGADFVVQSLHKTAGGLNPTALLHSNLEDSEITGRGVSAAISLITTTSPSYPLLASIEKNINFLNSKKGRLKILELLVNIETMKGSIKTCECCNFNDPTKILVKNKNMSGDELSEYLYNNLIEDERTNSISTMLLTGIGTTDKMLKRLENVLKRIKND